MKRIIDGKSYNTDTATLVGQWEHEETFFWQALYQTRHGAFFRITAGSEGEEEFRPLTDAEAQAFLEKCANHLVEKYFGPMPERGAAERRLTIRIPGNLADRIEDTAKAAGVSLNSAAMRGLEQYVQDAADASKCIETALAALERAQREPDKWESGCLAQAIGAYFRGAYRLALVEARMMLTPIAQRGDDGHDGKVFSLSELRKAFGGVETEPLRKFPHFGPIRFAGDRK